MQRNPFSALIIRMASIGPSRIILTLGVLVLALAGLLCERRWRISLLGGAALLSPVLELGKAGSV